MCDFLRPLRYASLAGDDNNYEQKAKIQRALGTLLKELAAMANTSQLLGWRSPDLHLGSTVILKLEMTMPKHLFSAMVTIVGVLLVSGAGVGQSGPTPSEFLKMVDTDNDKTISLPEIDEFALKKFDELKKPGEDALSIAELRGRISQGDFDAANTTRGNAVPTLSKAEFLAWVDKLFKEANTVGEKTLSEEELKTAAGEKLIRLLH
jgi:hypothetical protein